MGDKVKAVEYVVRNDVCRKEELSDDGDLEAVDGWYAPDVHGCYPDAKLGAAHRFPTAAKARAVADKDPGRNVYAVRYRLRCVRKGCSNTRHAGGALVEGLVYATREDAERDAWADFAIVPVLSKVVCKAG